jgi:membrane protein DedA with SNARE-associated domain
VNRVPLVLVIWFIVWTTAGYWLGRVLETPGFFTIAGFLLGFVTVFSWPFIFPERFQDWMEG